MEPTNRPRRECTKDTEFRWLCSCDDCSRTAAAGWRGLMDRVRAGDLELDEAQRLADTDPEIGGVSS